MGKTIMSIDVHSHAWRYPGDFSEDIRRPSRRSRAGVKGLRRGAVLPKLNEAALEAMIHRDALPVPGLEEKGRPS